MSEKHVEKIVLAVGLSWVLPLLALCVIYLQKKENDTNEDAPYACVGGDMPTAAFGEGERSFTHDICHALNQIKKLGRKLNDPGHQTPDAQEKLEHERNKVAKEAHMLVFEHCHKENPGSHPERDIVGYLDVRELAHNAHFKETLTHFDSFNLHDLEEAAHPSIINISANPDLCKPLSVVQ